LWEYVKSRHHIEFRGRKYPCFQIGKLQYKGVKIRRKRKKLKKGGTDIFFSVKKLREEGNRRQM
jgi:hypothetical protein